MGGGGFCGALDGDTAVKSLEGNNVVPLERF